MTHGKINIHFSDDHQMILVSGSLNFKEVARLRELGKKLLAQETPPEVVIDLGEIKRSDNSGLVLLVAWMQDARGLGKSIVYHQVPDFLLRMAQVFGLQTLLFNR